MADQYRVEGCKQTGQGRHEPKTGALHLKRVIEVPSIGHLHDATEGQTDREHQTIKACVVGFGNEKRDGSRPCNSMKEHRQHDGH